MKNWSTISDFCYQPDKNNKVSDLIDQLLKNRGLTTNASRRQFLNPDISQVTSQKVKIAKKELNLAANRIKQAIKNREKIVVYTDYDVDGITAGAIVWETIDNLKGKIMPFVPDRITDGYGLKKETIDKVTKRFHPTLLISVDHGITSAGEIAYAKKLGIDTIVIDHHLPPQKLPPAKAIIHSTKISAAAVAWIFAGFLYEKIKTRKSRKDPDRLKRELLELVALSTVADLLPLKEENRALVIAGLKEINSTRRVGLKALFKAAGLKKGEVDAFALGHILSPRLNAAGRIDNALNALRLICTRDSDRADDLADHLNTINTSRQKMTRDSTDMAVSEIKKVLLAGSLLEEKIIFVSSESYHQGIIGLIAGKLVEEYKRPAIVVSRREEYCKASARSIKGVNIVKLLRSASDLLVDVGGHPMAAGFTVHRDNLALLKEKLITLFDNFDHDKSTPENSKAIDLELDIAYVNDNLFKDLKKLSPFGVGNPEPLFISFGNHLLNCTLVGRKKNHLKLQLASGKNPRKQQKAIGFNLASIYPDLEMDSLVDIVYRIREDNYNGQKSLILTLADVRLSP